MLEPLLWLGQCVTAAESWYLRFRSSVGWALWGKQPGTDRDYSVLASSNEPLSEAEFASVLGHFVPGTPPTDNTDRPDRCPG